VVAGVVGVAIGAAIAVGAYQRRVSSLRDAVTVEHAQREVAELRGRKAELLAADKHDAAAVLVVDTKLEENRQAIAAARKKADVPDAELAAEFERLGY
jgi:hypothetical protein